MNLIKAGIIFLLTLVGYASFAPQEYYNPQHVTRLGLTLALTEGRLDLDRYAHLTVDIAKYDGHFYADKPPGLSFLALPAASLAKLALGPEASQWPMQVQTWFLLVKAASVGTVGLLAALAVAALYLLAQRLGASEGGALFASFGLAFATPFFGWSTTFFSHSATGSLLFLAVALAVWMHRPPKAWVAPLLGLMLGTTLTVDLTAAPAVAFVALFYVLGDRTEWRQRLLGGALGGVVGLLPLLIYNQLVFGSPFKLGYSQVVGFEGMKEGLFGLTAPNPGVLWEILFGLRRGLLPLSPLLLLVPVGWWVMWKRPDLRALVGVSLGVLLGFLLINASYFYWDGGSSTGPRHMIATLPLLALAFAFAWPARRWARVGALGLLAVSFVFSAATAAVWVFVDPRFPVPLLDPILKGLLDMEGATAFARALVPVLGFAALLLLRARSGAQRHQLTAGPLDPALQVEFK